MANNFYGSGGSYGSGGGYPYPWGGDAQRPQVLRHSESSISAVSALDEYHDGSSHRDSMVSLPSPEEGPRKFSTDNVDVSHIQLSSIEGSGVSSPSSSSRSRNGSSTSLYMPDILRVGTPTDSPTTSRSINPFKSSSQPYQPVSTMSEQPVRKGSISRSGSSRKPKARRSSSLLVHSQHGSIPEDEEYDVSLLGSAMPMSFINQPTSYSRVHDTVQEESEDGPGFGVDFSSFLGPPQNDAQWKQVNQQEKDGILTGGLGAGIKANTTLTSADLLASAPSTPLSPINRRMSFRNTLNRPSHLRTPSMRSPGLNRQPTIRELGQKEANKRGEVVEVIVEREEREEETAAFDISTFAADSTRGLDFDAMGGPKAPRKDTVVEVFYPQANWKPFSMRWPYLVVLVVLSIILAAAQEYLLHKGPLYTFTAAADLSTWDYFVFKYLPTIVAVSFGVLWQITDFEVKRLEAFYQLSKEGGALAAESINVDYITFFNFFRPIKALRFKHYAVAVSSLATLMAVSLVPTLQASSIELTPNRAQRMADPNGPKELHISPVYSRILSSILLLIALFGCVLIYQLERRPSGLVADVKGIAGIAAMANRSHILMDFKNMDTATPELIHQTLKSHRYSLKNSSLAPDSHAPLTQEEKDKYDQHTRHENPHPLMLRLVAGVPFIIGMLLFLVIVPVILFNPTANIVTEKIPWFITGLAVCIKLAWGTLETDVRMIEPFYILSRRHASPKVLTLDYTAMAFGWMPIRAFSNGHFLVGLVGLGSVLAEVLTICATSFAGVSGLDFARLPPPPPPPPSNKFLLFLRASDSDENAVNAGEETFASFWISFGLACAIISFLCFVAGAVYTRRRHPFLPRQPNSIASVLAFIHQSKMLYDFVGTEKMNNDEMVKRLGGLGKKYGLGWFTGRDGEIHCGVDEEELVSNYVHGRNARDASQPWNTNWEVL